MTETKIVSGAQKDATLDVFVLKKTVNYNDTSPVTVFTAGDGYMVESVMAEVVTIFDDGTSTFAVGISGMTGKFLKNSEIDLTIADYYAANIVPEVTDASSAIICTFDPNTSTQGQVIVYVKVTRIGG